MPPPLQNLPIPGPLARFIAPAGARAEIWRTGLGLGLIAVCYWGLTMGVIGLIGLWIGAPQLAMLLAAMMQGTTPAGLVAVLATFAPLVLGVLAVTRFLHRRPIASLFGPGAGRDFARCLPPLLILLALVTPFAALDPHFARSTPLAVLLVWLPLALPLLFVQIASEELLFRSYLLQQMAARFRSRLAWMLLPAALFGALHYAPSENGEAALLYALWATGFGILSADLVARSGNLGPSLAFHFANNISAMFLVGLYGQLDGLSLYTLVLNTTDPAAMAPYFALDTLSMLVFWLAIRLRLRA